MQSTDREGSGSRFEKILVARPLLPKFKQLKIKKIYLVPLMSVAGEHVKNDMGDALDSWKSILTRNGYQCEPI